jgi:hypothetical protein
MRMAFLYEWTIGTASLPKPDRAAGKANFALPDFIVDAGWDGRKRCCHSRSKMLPQPFLLAFAGPAWFHELRDILVP